MGDDCLKKKLKEEKQKSDDKKELEEKRKADAKRYGRH